MKRILACLLLFLLTLSPVLAADQGQEQVIITTANSNGTVDANARSITFIFSSTFVGTIRGVTFTGGAAADSSLTIAAQAGDTIGPVVYTISAGSMRIVALRRQ